MELATFSEHRQSVHGKDAHLSKYVSSEAPQGNFQAHCCLQVTYTTPNNISFTNHLSHGERFI